MRGINLVELMVVLSIAAVSIGVCVPSMTALIKSVQLSSASNDLLWGVLMARSEAIRRNGRAVICNSADGSTCARSGGWEQGWIVFHDSNNNGLRETGEAIVQRAQSLPDDLRVTGNFNVARYISYAPDGTTKLVGGGFQSGRLTVCRQSTDGGEARQIILGAGGRPRVQKTTVDTCG